MAIKTVIDTNVLVVSLSRKSPYHWLIDYILSEKIDVFVTDDILLEYEEILTYKYGIAITANFLAALREFPNVHHTVVYYYWGLLKDEDDNKFVDCYVAANASHLITNDRDFAMLKNVTFPKVNLYTIQEFQQLAV